MRNPLRRPGVFAVFVAVMVTYGCNSVEVDQADTIYGALAAAESKTEAKVAITKAFAAAGVGSPNSPVNGATYSFDRRDLDALAERLVAYNELRPDRSVRTFRHVHEQLGETDRPSSVDVETAVSLLWDGVDVLVRRDDQRSDRIPLLFLATAHGELPGNSARFDADSEVSPVQAAAFAFWLHQQGPGLASLPIDFFKSSTAGKTTTLIPVCYGGTNDETLDPSTNRDETCLEECTLDMVGGRFCPFDDEVSCSIGTCSGVGDPTTCFNDYVACLEGTGSGGDCTGELQVCVADHGGGGPPSDTSP